MKKSEECLFSIRMPSALVKRLDKEADRAQRSRSAEIRFRLEASLKPVRPRKTVGGAA